MTLRQYLLIMSLATSLCWLTWIFILLSTDPNLANSVVFLFFYLSLFLALLGTFSIIGLLIKTFFLKKQELIFRHVKKTFRQSSVISSFLVFVLFLIQKNLLTWWNLILLTMLFFILETAVFTNRHYSNKDYV